MVCLTKKKKVDSRESSPYSTVLTSDIPSFIIRIQRLAQQGRNMNKKRKVKSMSHPSIKNEKNKNLKKKTKTKKYRGEDGLRGSVNINVKGSLPGKN